MFASLCLLVYLLFTLLFVRYFPVVMTLSGVAGLVLSLGMAIDANILVLERLREAGEKVIKDKKIRHAAVDQAWRTIWDANITGFLVAIILAVFGVSIIK